MICFAMIMSLAQNSKHVIFAHDDVFGAVDGDLAAGILAEQHAVVDTHVEFGQLPVIQPFASAGCHHLTFVRLLLRRIGNDDAIPRGFFLVNAFDYDAVVQGSNVHFSDFLRASAFLARMALYLGSSTIIFRTWSESSCQLRMKYPASSLLITAARFSSRIARTSTVAVRAAAVCPPERADNEVATRSNSSPTVTLMRSAHST